MNCGRCGKSISEDFNMCPYCGLEVRTQKTVVKVKQIGRNGVQVKSTVPQGVEFELAGRRLTFSANVVKYNILRKRFVEKYLSYQNEYEVFYGSANHTYERLIDEEIPKFLEYVTLAIEFGVSVLYEYDITHITRATLAEMAMDAIDIKRALSPILEGIEEIEQYAVSLGYQRSISKMGRKEWVGGGFGIGGAIKGAIMAGALNVSTNMLRGIGDSISDAVDRAAVARKKEELANDGKTKIYLTQCLFPCCMGVFQTVWKVLVKEGKFESVTFHYKEWKERNAYYQSLYNEKKISYDEVVQRFCDAIQNTPMGSSFYIDLYRVLDGSKKELSAIADYFGVWTYKEDTSRVDKERLDEIRKMPEESVADLKRKIERLQDLCKRYPELNQKNYINELSEKKKQKVEQQKSYALSENEIDNLKRPVDLAFQRNDYEHIWNAINSGNAYAEYAMQEHYLNLCRSAIDNYDIQTLNNKTIELRERALKGDVFAKYLVAALKYRIYLRDRRSPEKEADAAREIIQISAEGNISAVYQAGFWGVRDYYNATAKEQDGLCLLMRAAKALYPWALYELGVAYRDAEYGLPEDNVKAEQYLTLASHCGIVRATKELSKLKSGEASSGCFITSAVCKSLGRADDCYELTLFRSFRDSWLAQQKDGVALIQEYYRVAPAIVKKIDATDNRSSIYQHIWETYLRKCKEFIEKGDYENCKVWYCQMVSVLKKQYAE